jgi:hypothetical protein
MIDRLNDREIERLEVKSFNLSLVQSLNLSVRTGRTPVAKQDRGSKRIHHEEHEG